MSLFFAGDFSPCRRYEILGLTIGKKIFGDLIDDIARADLAFLNLEAPLCIGGDPFRKTGPNLRSHPDFAGIITDAGFRAVGLANNHIMDFGATGLDETICACKKAGLYAVGAGKDLDQAQQPLYLKIKGLKIAFVAVAEHEFSIAGTTTPGAAPLDPVDNTIQIEQAREQADLVFVSIHGGNEYFQLPRPGLRKICRFYINRGADAVFCHHAHVPGAYEIYNNKLIVYSLGNLIFDHPRPPVHWQTGYAVSLEYTLEKKTLNHFQIIPYTQSVMQNGVRKMQGQEKAEFLEQLGRLKQIVEGNEAVFNKEWQRFCQKEKNSMLMKQYFPFPVKGVRKISKIIDPARFLVPTDTAGRVKLNLIRCESHRELLETVLDQSIKRV
jgi:poly-gamma-glutamate capsule biosynthesis protein CapA/YwtB (metallophosphatase superfamily)